MVRQNRARIQGGGICNGGTLVLSGATRVKGNTALWAGGIWNRHGTLSMDDTSSVTGNTCHATGAGVGNFGTMVMNGSSKVSDNHGDGVWVYSAATLTMNDSSSISRNVSSNDAGGVTLGGALTMNDSSSITGNSLAVDDLCWFAAGVSVTNTWGPSRPVSLTMTGSSVIRDNHAPCSAGGISNGVIRPDGLVIPGGTISGVNCAPQTYANVYGNTPDDCRLLWPIEG